MSEFYLCSELNCNKKYKTKNKFINHLLNNHNVIKKEDEIGDPVEITKTNKKVEQDKKNKLKKQELMDEKIKEIEKFEELKLQAKLKAEEKYKQEQMEKYMLLEEKKLLLEEEKLKQQEKQKELDEKWISLIGSIQNKIENNSEECLICSVNSANTVQKNLIKSNILYINIFNKTI